MVEDVERGKIVFFDEREGKKYGFAAVLDAEGNETGKQIFFHVNDVQRISSNGFDAVFFDRDGLPPRDLPRKGKTIVFRRVPGSEGRPKARPWGYASEWDRWERITQGAQQDVVSDSSDSLDDKPDDDESVDAVPSGLMFGHGSTGFEEPDEDDEFITSTEIRRRAAARFGNTELAWEVATQTPGDLI